MYQLNRIVVPRIASYWRVVVSHLNTDPTVIEELDQNSNDYGELVVTCRTALQHWLDTDKKASWDVLLSTLKQMRLIQAHKNVMSDVAELPMSVQ